MGERWEMGGLRASNLGRKMFSQSPIPLKSRPTPCAPWLMNRAERPSNNAFPISRSETRRKQRFLPFPVRERAGNSVSFHFPFGNAQETAFLPISHLGTRRKQRFFPFPVRERAGNSVSSHFPFGNAQETAFLPISRSGTRRKQRFFPFPVRERSRYSVSSVRFDFNNKKTVHPGISR